MRSIIKAALRVVIVFAFLEIVASLVKSIGSLLTFRHIPDAQDLSTFYVNISIASLIGLLILWAMWWKTDAIVRILVGNISENELVINTSNLDLIKVSMRILGIYLLATSIPDLFGLIAYHIQNVNLYVELNNIDPKLQADEIKWWVTTGVTILIGIWLVLGSRGIVTAIDKVWTAGQTLNRGKKER
ncbi:MAG: hypothetical protein V1767_06920 [Chloroflexota bacterium]